MGMSPTLCHSVALRPDLNSEVSDTRKKGNVLVLVMELFAATTSSSGTASLPCANTDNFLLRPALQV